MDYLNKIDSQLDKQIINIFNIETQKDRDVLTYLEYLINKRKENLKLFDDIKNLIEKERKRILNIFYENQTNKIFEALNAIENNCLYRIDMSLELLNSHIEDNEKIFLNVKELDEIKRKKHREAQRKYLNSKAREKIIKSFDF